MAIRYFLILMTLSCGFTISCKNVDNQEQNIKVETFNLNDITYPETSTLVSDSVKKDFLARQFAPWQSDTDDLLNSINSFPGKELSYLKKYLTDDEWYGENKKPHKRFLREAIVNNVAMNTFPNFLKKGIVIAHTNLRRLPTNRPGFDVYSKAGEGYPFDYFQETNLWANTPLQLLHLSNDKQWCYVISPYYKGWVAMKDVAIVSEDFRKEWTTDRYVMPLSDELSLEHAVSYYSVNAKIGMVLPYEETLDDSKVMVYYVTADENRNAHILKAEIEKELVAFDSYKFDGVHLKALVSELEGRPYGWGGNLENRDCSSLIRDLMATFKIWLPRDSKNQIEVGRKIDLKGSVIEKMEVFKQNAVPFRTILRKKGHNMLYVGDNEKGEPLVFHAIWGLKMSYSDKKLANYLDQYPIEGIHQDKDGSLKGRHIIGEAVITSVLAGQESNYTPSLLEEIYTMTTLLE